MSTIAIIPARGGSKGIPRKNVLPLAGRPLIAHTIAAARAAEHVERVVVSTDDVEIASVAEASGAEVVWRPAAISGDKASSEAALLHVLEHLERTENYAPDLVVLLQCTSPLTLAEDIDGTIRALRMERADSALAVTDFHYFLWRNDPQSGASGINHDKNYRPMRQDREPQFIETGAIYVMRGDGFRRAKHRFFGKTVTYHMPAERRLEIDEPVDFQVAEVLVRAQQHADGAALLPRRIAALVMDFDGVHTDNRVAVSEDGTESVTCSRSDGMGLSRLKQRGLPLLMLSKETNPVVLARCLKLGIECAQGIEYKLPWLRQWAGERGMDLAEIVYVGNDINDVECLSAVGCGVSVADAHVSAKAASQLVLTRPGGHGGLRELTDLIEKELQMKNTSIRTAHVKLPAAAVPSAEINGRRIGPGCPVYVIGEIGLNHNGDLDLAKKLIDAAALAGCDAVKFQKRTPELCVPPEQRNVERETPWGVMTYLEYRHRVEFGLEEYREIDAYCRGKNIAWFASCWDVPSVEFLEQFDPPCYKLASASITDEPLLKRHLATRRPIILSTGMSTMEQIRRAVDLLAGADLLIAHATSTYPCSPDELNLRMIETLAGEFPTVPVGYSGHEVGLSTTLAAVALGATFVERHITFDRSMWGSDQSASVEPWGLMRLVRDIRAIERALGDGVKKVYDSELAPMKKLRRAA